MAVPVACPCPGPFPWPVPVPAVPVACPGPGAFPRPVPGRSRGLSLSRAIPVACPCPGPFPWPVPVPGRSRGLSLSRAVPAACPGPGRSRAVPGACPAAVGGPLGGRSEAARRPLAGRHGAERGPGAPRRLRVLRRPERPLGLLRLERGAGAAPARHGRGRGALGCAGALGPNDACDVPAGLLEDLVKGVEVLPVGRDPLLRPLRAGPLRLPGSGHHPAPVPDRPQELLPVVRVEFHGSQVGAAAQPLLAPLPRRVRRHQHPQRLLSPPAEVWGGQERGGRGAGDTPGAGWPSLCPHRGFFPLVFSSLFVPSPPRRGEGGEGFGVFSLSPAVRGIYPQRPEVGVRKGDRGVLWPGSNEGRGRGVFPPGVSPVLEDAASCSSQFPGSFSLSPRHLGVPHFPECLMPQIPLSSIPLSIFNSLWNLWLFPHSFFHLSTSSFIYQVTHR